MQLRRTLAALSVMAAMASVVAPITFASSASARLDHAPCRAPLVWNDETQACEKPPPPNPTTWPGKWVLDDKTGFCLIASTSGQVSTERCVPISCYFVPTGPCETPRGWLVEKVAGGWVLKRAAGQCLDSNAAGQVYAIPCNGGDYQRWVISHSPQGGSQLQDVATGLCLDSNDNFEAYTLGCNGGDYQSWSIG